jgi:glutamate synthase (NADPH) small chain
MQGARCMDCGIPFCHQGCPLGEPDPDWNDLVYRDRWHAAIDRLHLTNNFPEFTGKLCPAPCEGSCVLGINDDAGHDQVDRGGDHRPRVGRRLGDAAAAELAHLEEGGRDRIGPGGTGGGRSAEPRGPLGDRVREVRSHRRPAPIRHPRVQDGEALPRPPSGGAGGRGVIFRPGVDVGVHVPAARILKGFDAVLLAGGAGQPRDLPVPGRELQGIHFAMDYLTLQNRRNAKATPSPTISSSAPRGSTW